MLWPKNFSSLRISTIKAEEDIKQIEYELARMSNDGWKIVGCAGPDTLLFTGSHQRWHYKVAANIGVRDVTSEIIFYRSHGMKEVTIVNGCVIMGRKRHRIIEWIKAQFPWNQTPEDDLGCG